MYDDMKDLEQIVDSSKIITGKLLLSGYLLVAPFLGGCEESLEDDTGNASAYQNSQEEPENDKDESIKESNEDEPSASTIYQEKQESSITPLPFTQEQFLYYVLDHAETAVIRNAQEWQSYKSRSSSPVFLFEDGVFYVPEPQVNFPEDMLVAHSFGPVGQGGFPSMDVTNVQVESNTIRVYVYIDSPSLPLMPPGYSISEQVLQGFAVRIPQSDLPVQVVPNYF